jgi:hypothetical protein
VTADPEVLASSESGASGEDVLNHVTLEHRLVHDRARVVIVMAKDLKRENVIRNVVLTCRSPLKVTNFVALESITEPKNLPPAAMDAPMTVLL